MLLGVIIIHMKELVRFIKKFVKNGDRVKIKVKYFFIGTVHVTIGNSGATLDDVGLYGKAWS